MDVDDSDKEPAKSADLLDGLSIEQVRPIMVSFWVPTSFAGASSVPLSLVTTRETGLLGTSPFVELIVL